MASWRASKFWILPCCFALFCGTPARGQTNLETNAGIQFNFSTPGAAHLALGGAFLAVADDATAAYTNPAGLTNIVEPELHIETRSWNFTHVFTDRGRVGGQSPTEVGIDTVPGLRDGEAGNRVSVISFLSYVYPYKNWAFALYRHELASFEAEFTTQGAFLQLTRSRNFLGFPALSDGRLASLHNVMRLGIVNNGISIAYRIRNHRLRGQLSLGIGLSYYDFFLDSNTRRFLPPLFEAPTFEDENLNYIQTQRGDDSDWSASIGFVWKTTNQRWSIGGVYRQGPDFDFEARSEPVSPAFESIVVSVQQARFHVPEVYGLGVAFEPTAAFKISFDCDRVEHSDITEDLIDIFNIAELFDEDPELEKYKIDDGNEYHLGLEYSLYRRKTPLILRIGAWHDPDHTLRFEGENPGLRAVYRRRGDQTHYSAGIGFSLPRLQFDVGFDYSERINTVSFSLVSRF